MQQLISQKVRRGRWLGPAAALAVTLVAATSQGALAKPAPTTPTTPRAQPAAQTVDPATRVPKGQAAPAPPVAACDLAPDADKPGRHEWLSCLSVGASLDRAPALGEDATVRIEVRADRPLEAAIEVSLSSNLEWVDIPAGLAKGGADRRPELGAAASAAKVKRTLRPGEVVELVGRVRAVKAGAAQIDARATSPTADGVDAGADSVLLTVGEAGATSKRDVDPPKVGKALRVNPGPPRAKMVPQQSVGAPAPATRAACDTHVTGTWGYHDQNNAWNVSPNFQVQVWNVNFSGNTQLASGVTDGNGNYNLCFDSAEPAGEVGTADVFVRFVSENSLWRVQRNGSPLLIDSAVQWDVVPGSTLNLGALTTADATLHRGLHAFDAINDVWQWIPKQPGKVCFDQKDAVCRQMIVNWSPSSVDGTYYSTATKDIHLAADDPNSATVVVHEAGHAIMDDVYADQFPAAPNCQPHTVQGVTSAGCAWTEGFAEWLPATVYNDPFFRWPSGASLDLENATWGNGWGDGDTVEGRVASALIDLTDLTNESPWDRYGEGSSAIWNTFTKHVSGTLSQFWAHRALDGAPVADAQLAELFQSTIDYGFRDPLSSYAQLTRPTPLAPHNFGFSTTSAYWSVTAIRNGAGADYDLSLYDDRNQSQLLSTSAVSGGVDFIAVDSNRRPLGDYYPRVKRYSGSGNYVIESAQGSSTLGIGSVQIPMTTSDVVAVRDVNLAAGTATFKVTPGSVSQDAELFLVSSTSSSSTWIRARNAAVASASATGANGVEQFSFTVTAATAGWYGLVLVNKSGSGTYTLTRS